MQERFGPYVLIRELGRGAMGRVFQARDPRSQRDVALKVPLGDPTPLRAERFAREGTTTAALKHPGIVRIHDAGSVDGRPYLAYELVPQARGLDSAWVDWPLRRRVEAICAAARAVGYAHDAGVVHRDLKPDRKSVV